MESGIGLDEVGLIGEGGASSVEGVGKFVDGLERFVGDGFVGQRPETLGRLEFGGVWGQETEMQALGDAQPLGPMPPGIVEDQDDGLVGTDAGGLGESIEDGLEQRRVDRTGEPPFHVAARRAHEGVEIEPLIFVVADGDGAFAGLGPDAPRQRLQAETVLVESPDLDRPVGGARRVHRLAEFFLNAAHSAGPAALACRGRGRCRLKPSRCR